MIIWGEKRLSGQWINYKIQNNNYFLTFKLNQTLKIQKIKTKHLKFGQIQKRIPWQKSLKFSKILSSKHD